ncbi:hypothetical protein ATANTOWER_023047, partial [Ataeniobius toweri]|nr:hypothetical protein [Ataeniobius toweri]
WVAWKLVPISSSLWAEGEVHPGQVASPSQRNTDTHRTTNHAQRNLERPIESCFQTVGGLWDFWVFFLMTLIIYIMKFCCFAFSCPNFFLRERFLFQLFLIFLSLFKLLVHHCELFFIFSLS